MFGLSLNRRWVQFRLRTLLACVTLSAIVCSWTLWNVRWIHSRHEAIESGRLAAGDGPYHVDGSDGPTAPGALGWFGELGFEYLELHFPTRSDSRLTNSETAEIARISRLFPEATVVVRNIGP